MAILGSGGHAAGILRAVPALRRIPDAAISADTLGRRKGRRKPGAGNRRIHMPALRGSDERSNDPRRGPRGRMARYEKQRIAATLGVPPERDLFAVAYAGGYSL